MAGNHILRVRIEEDALIMQGASYPITISQYGIEIDNYDGGTMPWKYEIVGNTIVIELIFTYDDRVQQGYLTGTKVTYRKKN